MEDLLGLSVYEVIKTMPRGISHGLREQRKVLGKDISK